MMTGKKIVFINQGFNYLTIDILNEFAKNYNDISVITGSIRVQDIPLSEKVNVKKIIRYNKKSLFSKIITWLIATIQIYFLLLFKYRNHELFFISIPPFAYLLTSILKNKYSLLIWDVYPDTLKSYNISENNLLYRFWQRLNKKIFPNAHRLYTIGNRMADLISKYVEKNKIIIVPLWTGLTKIKPIPKKENNFAIEHSVENKFVVQYSGNIGYTHNLEVLIEVAKELKSETRIEFLIIGRGKRLQDIKDLIKNYKLQNCTVLPFQPDEVLPYSLACADLGVVVLDEKTSQVSIPSKTYNLMAVGVPMLCIASVDSELGDYIERYDNGRIFSSNQIEEIRKYILSLSSNKDLLNKFKRNSLLASRNFTKDNAKLFFKYYE